MNRVRETGGKHLGNDNKAPSDGAIKQGSGQVRARKKEVLRNGGTAKRG